MSVSLAYARRMRHEPTPAERKLWQALRSRHIGSQKWRRQVPIGGFILDFYCPAARVAVEVDGETHADPAQDATRDAALRVLGVDVLHVRNRDVMSNLDGVLQLILNTASPPHPPTPAAWAPPSPARGEGDWSV